MKQEENKYFAFISYNSKDVEWGKKLQRILEHYRMPATLCSEKGWKRTPICPVFFAPTDIQPGGLTDELQERLRSSRNLIVICSPNSAKSEWVGREILFFHELGRTKNIHFFIVDGIPNSKDMETECFNPVIKSLNIPEILGANINEKNYRLPWLNRERAYVQLISKLLGVEFDSIWQRHKRILKQRVVTCIAGLALLICSLFLVSNLSAPVTSVIRLNELSSFNGSLPPLEDAVLTLTLDNEVKTDTISGINDFARFENIPHRYLNDTVAIYFECKNFCTKDTAVLLKEQLSLDIERDSSIYGQIRVMLWDTDARPIPDMTVKIEDDLVTSDQDGWIVMYKPLEKQKMTYQIIDTQSRPLGVLTMPCGKNDVIILSTVD